MPLFLILPNVGALVAHLQEQKKKENKNQYIQDIIFFLKTITCINSEDIKFLVLNRNAHKKNEKLRF